MKRKQLVKLAQWCEEQSRRCVRLANEAETSAQRRGGRYRGKNFARIATFLRDSTRESKRCT